MVLTETVGDNMEEPAIDYIRLGEILRRVHFLHTEGQDGVENPSVNKERALLFDIWHLLRGD